MSGPLSPAIHPLTQAASHMFPASLLACTLPHRADKEPKACTGDAGTAVSQRSSPCSSPLADGLPCAKLSGGLWKVLRVTIAITALQIDRLPV